MREEQAFNSPCFPCNSLPFLRRIGEILEENSTNGLGALQGEANVKARACMWVLMGQLYGQMAEIDLCEEWERLNEARIQELLVQSRN